MSTVTFSAACVCVALWANCAGAQEGDEEGLSRLGAELGAAAFVRNDVRVPNAAGTGFRMMDVVGDGAEPSVRIDAEWKLRGRHSLGIVIAPLEVSGSGALDAETFFSGELFAAGTAAGKYQFDVYKISYRYALEPRGAWQWKIGFTGLIRDASIALQQGDVAASYDNVGFAPLFHIDGQYRFPGRWRLRFDFDGLAGGPGRAFDIALKGSYDLGDSWQIGAGYRVLEGGVDTDDVYNFAWINYLLLDVGYRF